MNIAAAVFGLALVGLISSVYFTLAYYGRVRSDEVIPNVAAEGMCQSILNTPYARVFGLPNSVFGIGYYGLAALSAGSRLILGEWLILDVLVAVAVLAALFSLYLAWSLVFRVHVPCPICFLSHVINLTVATLLLAAI